MAADWRKIRAEYIKGGITHRKLAEKYGVDPSTVSRRASKENWAEERKQSETKTQAEIARKTIKREAEKTVDYLQMAYDINDAAIRHIEELMAVTTDSKAMQSYMRALQIAIDIKRGEKHLDTESKRLDIERERLELEKVRANASDDEGDETGVIVLAPVLPRGGDGDG